MYKVFFKESFFGLTDDSEILKNHQDVLIQPDKNELFSFVYSYLKEDSIFHATLYHPDLNLLFSHFQSCFKVVGAAGGVVRHDGKILMIKRLGIPDLPKRPHRSRGRPADLRPAGGTGGMRFAGSPD